MSWFPLGAVISHSSVRSSMQRPCNCSNLDIWTSFFWRSTLCAHHTLWPQYEGTWRLTGYTCTRQPANTAELMCEFCSAIGSPCPSVAKLTCLRLGSLLIWLIDCHPWQTENFDSAPFWMLSMLAWLAMDDSTTKALQSQDCRHWWMRFCPLPVISKHLDNSSRYLPSTSSLYRILMFD